MSAQSATRARTVTYRVQVEFGDCDPAGIVWFPNYFRWIDAASRHYFIGCGVPRWEETARTLGVIGTPLVDTRASFRRPASYGDALEIDAAVTEWRHKSFVLDYRVRRGEELILECQEVRIFAARAADGSGISAVPIPASIRTLCDPDFAGLLQA